MSSRHRIDERLDPAFAQFTVNLVVFTVLAGKLHVVMRPQEEHPFLGCLVLPGARLKEWQTLDEAVVDANSLLLGSLETRFEQFRAFDDLERDPRGRVVSIVYISGAPAEWMKPWIGAFSDSQLVAIEQDDNVVWLTQEDRPVHVGFDHNEIVTAAVHYLRCAIEWSTLGFTLVPDVFTLSDLQEAHEAVLARALNKQSFRNRMLNREFGGGRRLQPYGELRRGAHRPAQLYRLA